MGTFSPVECSLFVTDHKMSKNQTELVSFFILSYTEHWQQFNRTLQIKKVSSSLPHCLFGSISSFGVLLCVLRGSVMHCMLLSVVMVVLPSYDLNELLRSFWNLWISLHAHLIACSLRVPACAQDAVVTSSQRINNA